ncbi:MAG TPA: PA domain-containing protein, partial [Thermoanaerobaculia bacterium]
AAAAMADATITIINGNAPGVGYNDPTPVAPVGGNPGTTLGQQRLIAVQYAADLWGQVLDSNVEIFVLSGFVTRNCTATGAVLASAGSILIVRDFGSIPPFPGAEFPATFYHTALANKRAGADLIPGPNGTTADDIQALFNINLGQPGCLTGFPFYYGLDGNHGTMIDLVSTALHEIAHGLGFSQFANVSTGRRPGAVVGPGFEDGFDDIYNRRLLDTTQNLLWPQMSNAQRTASAINSRHVVWTGSEVTNAVPQVLQPGTPLLRVNSPGSIAGIYSIGPAAFGAPLTAAGVTGNVVVGLDPADGAGPLTTDACSPLTNAGAVAGNVALVDRGTCGFIVKVKNAQNAGAIAVIVADNVLDVPPPGLGGADPTITIPSGRVSLPDGTLIRTNLPASVTLQLDLSVIAGADPLGRAMLNAPNPVQPGSSISHWDPIATRNLLMEPAINADLTRSVEPPEDLTLPQMRDVGWFPDADTDGIADAADACDASIQTPTVVIDGCDSGVPNTLLTTGCTISDEIAKCAAGAGNHGGFVSCVSHFTNSLKKAGIITGAQKGAIQSCAAGAAIP